jgi:hypothetical protein
MYARGAGAETRPDALMVRLTTSSWAMERIVWLNDGSGMITTTLTLTSVESAPNTYIALLYCDKRHWV